MAEWVWIDGGSLVLSLQVLMPLFSCCFHLYLSILIQLDTMKQTQRGTAEEPSITHYYSCPRLRHQKLSVSLWYVLRGCCNDKKMSAQQVIFFCKACGWLTQKSCLPQTLCILLPPFHAEFCTPICSLPWELLVTAFCSICHILNEWLWPHLNYSGDLKQSPGLCFVTSCTAKHTSSHSSILWQRTSYTT